MVSRRGIDLRVIQVVREFSLQGGVEAVAYQLQCEWRRLAVPAIALTGSTLDCGVDVKLVKAPFQSLKVRGSSYLKYLHIMLAVPTFSLVATLSVRWLRKDTDVILSHGDTLVGDALVVHAVNKAGLRAKLAAKQYRWLFNPMHLWVAWRDQHMIGGLRYQLYIAISRKIANELRELYHVPADRIVMIPNGVDVTRFAPGVGGRDSVRNHFAIPSHCHLLLFVGHEFQRKGLAFVIEALSTLPGFYLLVVGNDDPSRYQRQAEEVGVLDRIAFAGPRSDLPALYQAADALVFPTIYEAFPLVAIEAMASGLPVFATAVGGIEDYIVHGENGYFIERNADSIARQLAAFFAEPSQVAVIRENARKTALNYSWENIAKQYLQALAPLSAR